MKRVAISPLRALALAVAAGTAGTVLLARPAPAQVSRVTRGVPMPGSMGIPQPEPLITVSVSQRSLGRILSEIFKQANYKYQVLADTGTTVFSLNVQKMPLSQALKTLLEQDKSEEPLVYSFTPLPTGGGIFAINREIINVGAMEGENRVSVANARITQVLPKVFELMKAQYRIEADVPPIPISVELRPDDWANTISQILLEAGKVEPTLTYSMDGDAYVVHLQKTPLTGTAAQPARKVSLNVTNESLKSAVEKAFQGSQWQVQVSPKVADIKVAYNNTNETELQALRTLLRQASLGSQQVTYREGKGTLFIEPGPLSGDIRVGTRPKTMVGLVTLNVKGQRLRLVTGDFARQANVKIEVPQTIPDYPVTLKVDNVPVEDALEALIEALSATVPNLKFKAIGKTYQLIVATPNTNP